MVPNVGFGEMIVIAVVALLVLGPAKLPGAARSLGKGLREFKDAVSGAVDDEERVGRHPHDPPAPR